MLRADLVEAWVVAGGVARPAGRTAVVAPTLVAPPPAPAAARRSPWIYAIAAGAAAATVGLVILASQSGSSTQRIEVKWP